MKLGDHLGVQFCPLLYDRRPLLGLQPKILLLLGLGQEVDDPLAGLGIPLEQLILLLLHFGGLLLIPSRPLR